MKIEDIVRMVSKVYRDERGKICELDDELRVMENDLYEVKKSRGQNITLGDYNSLKTRKEDLETKITLMTQYCEGISRVRELLMDLGFDVEVEED
jgi:hypothetical protein